MTENNAVVTTSSPPVEDSVNLLSPPEHNEIQQPEVIQEEPPAPEHEEPTPSPRARTFSDTDSQISDYPENDNIDPSAPSSWDWLSNLQSRLKTTNNDIRTKLEKSNKALEEKILTSNKLIEEKFHDIAAAPARAAGSLRRRHTEFIEQKENEESEHWKHERKLISNFECLDYTTIYNKSYRTELYMNFFNVRGSYEWLRWILSFIIAVCIGLIAWSAKFFIKKIIEFKFMLVQQQMDKEEIGWYALAYFMYTAASVGLAALGCLIAVYWEPTSVGSGIPEVKAYLNGTKVPHFLRLRTLWAKFGSAVLANGAGLPVGAEGPMIHMGALVGNGVSQAQSKELQFQIPFMKHFRNDRDKRDFITSGAGAGVAAAFGAPLGGTLFSLEEVSSFWSTLLTWRTFFTCMIAVLTGELLLEIQSGEYKNNGLMIFNVGSRELTYQPLELIPFVIIGIIGGVLGAGFTAMNLAVGRMRGEKINKQRKWRLLEVVLIALACSSLQFLLPFAFGCKEVPESCSLDPSQSSGDTTVNCEALQRHYCKEGQYNDLASIMFNSNENTVVNLLKVGFPNLISLVAIGVFFLYYLLGAGYTAGCGISSGLFVPMVVIGAAYGRIVGMILMKLYPSQFTDAGIFAIMGTAAFMAGVSRLTVSLTVIIIEITNDLANLLPIMLAVMTAKLAADLINHPLFDSQITAKHIPYLEPNPVKEMKILMCKHIMARRPNYFTEKDNVGNILTILKNTVHNGFPVVNNRNDKNVKGIILRPQLIVLLDRISQLWISRADMVYSHHEYQTKLAWNLPKLQDIALTEDDYDVEIDLTPYMNLTVYSVNEEFAVSEAFLMFRTMGLRHLLVVNENNRLKGMITKKDLVEHNCIEKYKELKRLKKMNIDLPMGQEFETVPGTPAEPADPSHSKSSPHPTSIRDALRRHLSSSSLLTSSQSFISRNLTSRATSPAASPAVQARGPPGPIDPDVRIV